MTIQQPVVAGSFYPAEPEALAALVDGLLAAHAAPDIPDPKALILPHAGYRFSGAIAAAGAARLGNGIRRVVILGPSHRHAFRGIAVPDAEAMATPLGAVPIDRKAVADLLALPCAAVVPQAFAAEHSIEVELPLLQRRLDDFAVVPVVVGDVDTPTLAEALARVWGGPETLVIISTDLTHFLDAATAAEIDTATARAIELADPGTLTAREACGHRPLAAFLTIAGRTGLRLSRLALGHSGDTTGDTARVVGYGAWAAYDPEASSLPVPIRHVALRSAAQALFARAQRGHPAKLHLPSFPAPLQTIGASFVTLTIDGRLRGCIGSLKAHAPLAEDIATNAVKAGFNDPRFSPVSEDDIRASEIEIALLSRPAPMQFDDEHHIRAQLRPGRDGLILQSGRHRGTFLPKVWEALPDPTAFLNGLKVKAGLDRDGWPDQVQVWRYAADCFRGRLATKT